jgi:hypothetical protein
MLYIALLHYPVLNKEGQVVTTAIANMDIHDIARAAKTFGVKDFYIINPIEAQQDLAGEIIRHWKEGYGASFNLSRKEAFELITIKKNLDEALREIKSKTGCVPRTIVTGANLKKGILTFGELKNILKNDELPYLLIFGTASGIADEVIKKADFRLEPIKGVGDYNHLAVRSAVAIILDRITSN